MCDQWRPVAGWDGIYEVSSLGYVRSLPRERVVHKDGRKRTFPGKILTGAINRGYVLVNLRDASRHQGYYVHSLVLIAFVGDRPDGCHACHFNGVRTDNRLENLRWDTPKENHQDRVRHGTSGRGQNNHNAILTESEVIEIRNAKNKTELLELAAKFGVTARCIRSVKSGESWKHVQAWQAEHSEVAA